MTILLGKKKCVRLAKYTTRSIKSNRRRRGYYYYHVNYDGQISLQWPRFTEVSRRRSPPRAQSIAHGDH